AEVTNHSRVSSLVNRADKKKQRAGRDAMIKHLIESALHALLGKGKQTEHHESHVTDRGIGNQPLYVRLDHCDQRPIDYSYDRQRDHDPGKIARSFGKQTEVE